MRLRIEIDGAPFRSAWRDAYQRTFEQFDGDHDGRLTSEQAGQVSAIFGGTRDSGRCSVSQAFIRGYDAVRRSHTR